MEEGALPITSVLTVLYKSPPKETREERKKIGETTPKCTNRTQLLHHLVPFRREAEGLDSTASIGGDTNPKAVNDRPSSCVFLLALLVFFLFFLFDVYQNHVSAIHAHARALPRRDSLIPEIFLNIADSAPDRRHR